MGETFEKWCKDNEVGPLEAGKREIFNAGYDAATAEAQKASPCGVEKEKLTRLISLAKSVHGSVDSLRDGGEQYDGQFAVILRKINEIMETLESLWMDR